MNNRSNNVTSSSSFGAILIRRKANERPSDIELRLRPLCTKIRIVERLAGNAHLTIPGTPSLAVRIYTADDIAKLPQTITAADDDSNDVDGLQHFRDSYEHSLVFFVLAGAEQSRLEDWDYFANAAQRALLTHTNKQRNDSIDNTKQHKQHTTRTLIVPDITSVINCISSVISSMTPEKRIKKAKYFTQLSNQHYLPNNETGEDPTREMVANHVIKTFREWADRMDMPPEDVNVLLDIRKTLGNIVTADGVTLDDLPIQSATKDIITMFFGTPKGIMNGATDVAAASSHVNDNTNEDNFDTGSISDAFDDIADEDLLQIPDPSSVPMTEYTPAAQQQWSSTNKSFDDARSYNHSRTTGDQSFFPSYYGNQGNNANAFDPTAAASYTNEIDFTPIQHNMYHQTNHPPPRASVAGQYHPSSDASLSSIFPHAFATPHGHNFRNNPTAHNRGYPNGYTPRYSRVDRQFRGSSNGPPAHHHFM